MSRSKKTVKGLISSLQTMKAQGALDQQQVESLEAAIVALKHGTDTLNRRELYKAIERATQAIVEAVLKQKR